MSASALTMSEEIRLLAERGLTDARTREAAAWKRVEAAEHADDATYEAAWAALEQAKADVRWYEAGVTASR